MNRAFSVYLDVVRFAAACLVYMYHSNQRWLVSEPLPMSNYGHSSVIVFFVLSGFVIAYITDVKENDWVTYAASRLSRVFSVVLPTLALTLLLDTIGRLLQPSVYAYPFDQFIVRSIGSLLMLNEIWFVSITTFSNVPYWSITYEFWYYVIFGAISFLPRKQAVIGVLVLFAVLGPKFLLLAPIWYAGVLLYRWKRLYSISLMSAYLLSIVSIVAIVGMHLLKIPEQISMEFKNLVGPYWYTQLTFSKFFVADYILCALVFANFVGLRRVFRDLDSDLSLIEKPIRFIAGYTFTLYLLHQPLFLFWGSVLQGDPITTTPWLIVTALTVLTVLLVGHFTENRRHLMRRYIAAQLEKLNCHMKVSL